MGTDLPPALPAQRRERLLRLLDRGDIQRVADLAAALEVAPVTVRRDIAHLADQGQVRRVRGGAVAVERARAKGADESARAEAPSIGIVVPSMKYYWPDVVRGARETAQARGARLVLRGSTYDARVDRRNLARLVDGVGVAGLVIAPMTSGAEGEELVRWMQELTVPIVLAERTAVRGAYGEPMDSVTSNHELGAAMALRLLVRLGHQRIGLVTVAKSPTTPAVRAGWRSACVELGLDPAGVPDVDTEDYGSPTWPERLDSVLDATLASRTTALLVHSDAEAIALLGRCDERGIRVPEDLSVIAYDDEVASMATPPLTAVHPPKTAIGRAAVELLLNRVRSPEPVYTQRVVISPELRVRQSTAPPAASR
ncbi:DeoR family transcriptional regulator [Georgenia wutianyii]|uniref:DeoR family transcriptional regulator n=1 Tax=Georgenia wutianyii TaxID=2585135 RepID=A0ABX5VNL5_9MICO|nr:substrate-binding domain-containing protein [Georgenia wutianyii]QDB79830.1 DeoR family transcriptional regulator [Georgenia wutianyii]